MHVDYLYIFFGETSLQVLCLFLNQVIYSELFVDSSTELEALPGLPEQGRPTRRLRGPDDTPLLPWVPRTLARPGVTRKEETDSGTSLGKG